MVKNLLKLNSIWKFQFRLFSSKFDYDVLVVGGGHAGVEAANAACNLKAKTILVTQRLETIGEMSCNPSFGGVGKCQLMREIDALDGLCSKICDQAGIHFKILNKKKGPAVQGLRAQIDRVLYKKYMKEELFSKPIDFEENSVEDLLINNKDGKFFCEGVILNNGKKIRSRKTIITTGTFLNGLILIGQDKFSAGRMGDKASINLSNTFKNLNFKMGRLKTGTPPRLYSDSIDYEELEKVLYDENPEPFSYMNNRVRIEPSQQLPCWITYTDDSIIDLVKNYINSSSYIRQEAQGVRYCPSLEAKILKFNSDFHQVWIEPEGYNSDVVYPNGLTTGFSVDHQQKIVNSIKGLRRAKLAKPGYSIEYDYIDPTQLFPTLETKLLNNLYLAGQINGTTGYEEAAAQGLLAGINAAGQTQKKSDFLINRTDGFIGVIVDDLTSRGVTEPYRMMTVRSEYRMFLRPDNADKRLTARGYEYGCVSKERYDKYLNTIDQIKLVKNEFEKLRYANKEWKRMLNTIGVEFNPQNFEKFSSASKLLERIFKRVSTELRYSTLVKRQNYQIEQLKKEEALELGKDFDYLNPTLKLSKEAIEILNKNKPSNIASAAKLPGICQQTIYKLIFYIRKNFSKDK